ncbi:hypothetical protein CerSpe_249100 [Prunus speciosa]
MTSAGVAGMMFQCVFEGSLSMRDSEIERRPYHKNCSCALHRSEGDACSNASLVLKHQIDFEEILLLCGVSFLISSTFIQV